MVVAPVIYALGDLTGATKANACEAARLRQDAVDWTLVLIVERVVAGDLDREYDLWGLVLKPWRELELPVQPGGGAFEATPSLHRHRRFLADAIRERRSFVALADPTLIRLTVREGYWVHWVVPTPAQVMTFNAKEQVHYQTCSSRWTQPLSPLAWDPELAVPV